MKWFIRLLIILPIIAAIIAIFCGVPVLDWVAWLFKGIANIFSAVGNFCAWLQKLINLGVIKK